MAIATVTTPPAGDQPRPSTADRAVAGHRRGVGHSWFWSVRTQLLAPILVTTLGLVVLGVVQTAGSIASASDATRAQVVSSTATATVRLTHELERELAETAALRERGGHAGEQLVTAQRARTDDAVKRYRAALTAASRTTPALDAEFHAADVELGKLTTARTLSDPGGPTDNLPDPVYHDITTALLAVADALPSQLRDPKLSGTARDVAALAAVEHYHALERDLLHAAFSRGSLQGNDLVDLARIDSARQEREAEFTRVADAAARARYDKVVKGPDVEAAARMRDAVFAGQPGALEVDADAWYVAQSSTIRKVNLVGLALSDQLDRDASQVATSATRRAWLTGGGSVGIGLLALGVALALAVRTSRRLRRLRAAALTVARHELPAIADRAMAGAVIDASRGLDSAAASITRGIAASGDEVGEVADAFSSVHRTALRLAGDQAQLHADMARMAETFARRIRTLITRQLRLLDEFEQDETDPDALERFFALDHLATRLRRNGENLLVLAGGEPGRPVSGAFPLAGVVTAAASEIEDFKRVEAQPMDVAVVGPVVGDLVHLLAELLENATSFSPPDTPVRVDARRTVDGVVLRVHDSGIGLTEARLAEVNRRLTERTARLSSAATGTMGLHVVARLAARHGIRVQLHTTGSGTVAYVLLPLSVLDSPAPVRSAPAEQAAAEPVLERAATRPARPAPVPMTALPRAEREDAVPLAAVPLAAAPAVPAVPVSPAPVGPAAAAVHGDGALRVPATVSAAASLGAPKAPVERAQSPAIRPTAPPAVAAVTPAAPAPAAVPAAPVPATAPAAAVTPAQATAPAPATAPPPAAPIRASAAVVPDRSGGSLLPRRRPGTQLAGDPRPAPAPTPRAPVDPHSVRTRLSALAEGVAAAKRNTTEPTTPTKDR